MTLGLSLTEPGHGWVDKTWLPTRYVLATPPSHFSVDASLVWLILGLDPHMDPIWGQMAVYFQIG
jgi:hypothetical protein